MRLYIGHKKPKTYNRLFTFSSPDLNRRYPFKLPVIRVMQSGSCLLLFSETFCTFAIFMEFSFSEWCLLWVRHLLPNKCEQKHKPAPETHTTLSHSKAEQGIGFSWLLYYKWNETAIWRHEWNVVKISQVIMHTSHDTDFVQFSAKR